jgi:hypothetical protein
MTRSLLVTEFNGGQVQPRGDSGWNLSIPPGAIGQYRWAQLDDYRPLRRSDFLWRPPVTLRLRARVNADRLPGTWGFGLWNDPFTMSLFVSGASRKLPALPQAAWFFYASPPNYLSFRNDKPANGLLAATFRSLPIPSLAFAPAAVLAPLLLLRPLARLARGAARRFIREDAALLSALPSEWHAYRLEWQSQAVTFWLDEQAVFRTPVSPRGPLGFVLWIDNQFAAFEPTGTLRFGSLPNNSPQTLEIEGLEIS